jgi:hypothetical protein
MRSVKIIARTAKRKQKNQTNFYVSVVTHFTVRPALNLLNAKNVRVPFVVPIQFNAMLAIAESVSTLLATMKLLFARYVKYLIAAAISMSIKNSTRRSCTNLDATSKNAK